MSRVPLCPAGLVGLLASLLLLPPAVSAQAIFVGGGAGLPLGDFGEVAEPGYQLLAGGSVEVGGTRFAVGLAGLFGRNGHALAGERSTLYSVSALGGYRAVESGATRLTLWGGLGGAVHARSSDTFPGLDASKRGLVVSAGATGSYALERVRIFLLGFYTRGLGGLGSSSYPTELVTAGAGVSIPIGRD